jgi:signal recognition particle subunit SRP54
MVAADLQRPAAIEQLHTIGRQLDVAVYSDLQQKDPVKVCREGVKRAKEAGAQIVILDTAGRLAIDQELMAQLTEIDKHVHPDQVFLVVDGMTGQDAVNSAKAFNEAIELDGVIMTKLDGDARGGALLSVKHVTQVPIKFIGTGEHLDALEPFRPEGMASRILQMGDIVAVAQEAHRIIDDREREKLEARMASGTFTLEDFRGVLEKIAKPGLMQKMMGLLPGMGDINKMMAGADTDGEMRRLQGIIDSMTPAERQNPNQIDTPRRNRISRGAGVAPHMVSGLIKQFNVMAPMMKMMASGGIKDRMEMMKQLQGGMLDPNMGGIKTKQSTGKRLTPKERERMQRERDKLLRKKRRGN